ncbi:MAG: hypothetical protein KC589_00560 [Nanoarchaeota archaeon]|nr:hypothetical protein [Nanoarchaeota archaeon]
MDEILESLGLTKQEINVYKTLLDNGPLFVSSIAQKTGIHRRNIYDCLERLGKKGLVGYIKENNKKSYSVLNPKIILEKLEKRKESFEEILPEILNKYNVKNEKKETLFFRGKEGLKQIFEDQLIVEKEILINGANSNVEETLKYFFPRYNRIRKEKKIKCRIIFDESFKNEKNVLAQLKKIPLSKIKFISNFNKTPTSQYIYGDNVAIVVWSENPLAILIRQKEIAQNFKDSFELMWKLD